MPIVNYRSRSLRRISVKTPGARVVVHHRKRKPKGASCGNCRAILKGTPRERPYKMMTMAKTMKRPERPYGGVLCSRCMRSHFKQQARG